ncbi:MAG: xylulose kinase, partial [Firmicutes bacterium]|nr:xylulose kinase [Bacillota bacterium]
AYEARRQIHLLESGTGNRIEEILLYGGGARNRLWCQILASVTGRKVKASAQTEATALGAAMCAAWGIKRFPTLEAAVTSMGAPYEVFLPDPVQFEFYDRLYNQVYKIFYDRVQDLDSLRTRLASTL